MIALKTNPAPRVYQLHTFLMDAFNENPSKFHKAKAIQDAMPLVYLWKPELDDDGNIVVDGKGNPILKNFYGSVGRAINSDVQIHNNCGKFQKIIIGDRNKGYKIATEDEYLIVSAREWKEIVSRIKRRRYMDAQYQLHGQFKIQFEEEPNGRPINEIFPAAKEEIKAKRVRKAKPKKPIAIVPPIPNQSIQMTLGL